MIELDENNLVNIGTFQEYNLYVDENLHQVMYYRGFPKQGPFFAAPPKLTIALQILNETFEDTKRTKESIEKYKDAFHHYLFQVSEVEYNIMINRRLFYLDQKIKELLHQLDEEELIKKGIHEKGVYE